MEIVPAKVVFTRKPLVGKRRARIVACGNIQKKNADGEMTDQPNVLSRKDVYASGLDSIALRIRLGQSALEEWASAMLDIRKAFLHAPLSDKFRAKVRRTILVPPRILSRANLISVIERWTLNPKP